MRKCHELDLQPRHGARVSGKGSRAQKEARECVGVPVSYASGAIAKGHSKSENDPDLLMILGLTAEKITQLCETSRVL